MDTDGKTTPTVTKDIEYLFTKLGELITASEERMKAHISSELQPIKEQLTTNTNNINQLTIQSNKLTIDINTNSTEITEVKEELREAKEAHKNTEERLFAMEEKYHTMSKNYDILAMKAATTEVRLEDQTNRGLRKTLVIRNVKEQPHEKWADTRNIVVDSLQTATKIDRDYLYGAIERVHRGKSTGIENKKAGKRDIFALFYDWNKAQEVLSEFRKNGRKVGIYVDQMYGPDTTYRRNAALKKRKEMLADKTIEQGFVDHPAKLMVKTKKTDAAYHIAADFSALEIPLTTRVDG